MKQCCKNCTKCKTIKGLSRKNYICLENSNVKAGKIAYVNPNANPCEDYEVKDYAGKESK